LKAATRKQCLITLASLFFLQACDDLTQREEDVTITLDTFDLVGTDGAPLNGVNTRARVSGNPGCTAEQTSLNSLLAQVDNFDDFDDFLETIDLRTLRYRVSNNNTPVATSASMEMTDPATNELVTIASVEIGANENFDDFRAFPFSDIGAATVTHFLDNLDASFLYCVEGTPNSSELQMSIDLELDLVVTVDIL